MPRSDGLDQLGRHIGIRIVRRETPGRPRRHRRAASRGSGFEEAGGGQHGEPVLVPGVAHLDLAETRTDPGAGHRRPDPDGPQVAQDERGHRRAGAASDSAASSTTRAISPPLKVFEELSPSSERGRTAVPGPRRSQPTRCAKGSASRWVGGGPWRLRLSGRLRDSSGEVMNEEVLMANTVAVVGAEFDVGEEDGPAGLEDPAPAAHRSRPRRRRVQVHVELEGDGDPGRDRGRGQQPGEMVGPRREQGRAQV